MYPDSGPHTPVGIITTPATRRNLVYSGSLRATRYDVFRKRYTMKVYDEQTVPSILHSPFKNIA
jgi:hypothetical protein